LIKTHEIACAAPAEMVRRGKEENARVARQRMSAARA
jgi:hypothetical protein